MCKFGFFHEGKVSADLIQSRCLMPQANLSERYLLFLRACCACASSISLGPFAERNRFCHTLAPFSTLPYQRDCHLVLVERIWHVIALVNNHRFQPQRQSISKPHGFAIICFSLSESKLALALSDTRKYFEYRSATLVSILTDSMGLARKLPK